MLNMLPERFVADYLLYAHLFPDVACGAMLRYRAAAGIASSVEDDVKPAEGDFNHWRKSGRAWSVGDGVEAC